MLPWQLELMNRALPQLPEGILAFSAFLGAPPGGHTCEGRAGPMAARARLSSGICAEDAEPEMGLPAAAEAPFLLLLSTPLGSGIIRILFYPPSRSLTPPSTAFPSASAQQHLPSLKVAPPSVPKRESDWLSPPSQLSHLIGCCGVR